MRSSKTIPVSKPYPLPFRGEDYTNLSFGGNLGSVTVNSNSTLDITGALTLMVWAKLDKVLTTTQCFTSKGIGLSGNGPNGYALSYFPSANAIYFDYYSATTRNNVHKDNVNMDSNYHHIVGTWDGTTNANSTKLYLDGALMAQATATIASIATTGFNFKVGQNGNESGSRHFLAGKVLEVIVLAQTISGADVYNLMTGRISPTLFDCRVWYDFRLGHTLDLSGTGNNGTLFNNVRFMR